MTNRLFLLLTMCCAFAAPAFPADRATENVILVIADGLRWQEVFRGVDNDMITTANSVSNPDAFRPEFDAATTEARRARLMPFLWDHVAKHGQLYGNRDRGSVAHVTNKFWFSYPGYNELVTGYADDTSITTNRKIPNPNTTVFEWLEKKPEYEGRVAAFGAWDVFPYIFNTGRSGLPVDSGVVPFKPSSGVTPGMAMINRIRETTPYRWKDVAFDSLMFPMFTEYLQHRKPRVTFLALGETDSWAHEGNYEKYLESAHRVDGWLRELWNLVQSMPEYRDKTTIIFTSDHGRGDSAENPKAWNSHSREFAGSESFFLAVWGPDTPALGEVTGRAEVTQSQVAATLAAALGEDYVAAQPKAAPPVAEAIKPPAGALTAGAE